jgi:hypothetical protein
MKRLTVEICYLRSNYRNVQARLYNLEITDSRIVDQFIVGQSLPKSAADCLEIIRWTANPICPG